MHAACLAVLLCPLAAHAAAPPAPRPDSHGDPLPPGAIARLGTVRFRHPGRITSLWFSPDGKTLISGGSGIIKRWEVPTGRPIGDTLRLHGDEMGGGVQLFGGRDGLRAVSWPTRRALPWPNTRAVVYDAATGKELRELPKEVTSLKAIAPDGSLVVESSHEKNATLITDGLAGRELFRRTFGGTDAVAFSADGKQLLISTYKDDRSSVEFLDARTGKSLRRIGGLPVRVRVLALSPDGKTLATLHTTTMIADKPPEDPKDMGVTLRDAATGKALKRLGHIGWDMAFSPDSKTLAVENYGLIELYDAATGKPCGQASRENGPSSVAWRPSGKEFVATTDRDVRAVSPSGRVRTVWSLPNARYLSADGVRAAWVDKEGRPHVRDLATGKELADTGVRVKEDSDACLTFSPHCDVVGTWTPGYYGHGQTGGFQEKPKPRLWDLTGGAEISLPGDLEDELSAFSISPDGKLLVMGNWSSTTLRWLDRSRKPLALCYDPADERKSDWSPLALCGFGRSRKKKRSQVPGKLAFTADSRTLAASTWNDELVLWEVVTGKMRSPVMRHPCPEGRWNLAATSPIAFSRDGRLLASGGVWQDYAVRVWDVATGKEHCRFTGHDDAIGTLAFSPDGRTLVSTSADRTALVWAVPPLALTRPSAERLARCWDDLASPDAPKAFRAVCDLTAAGDDAVAHLRERVAPAQGPSRAELARWAVQMDDEEFDVREEATRRMREAGEAALEVLRETADGPSAEARRRARKLLAPYEGAVPPAEVLRQIRAVEAMERIGSKPARLALRRLAGGSPSRLTSEAAGSLRRLAGR